MGALIGSLVLLAEGAIGFWLMDGNQSKRSNRRQRRRAIFGSASGRPIPEAKESAERKPGVELNPNPRVPRPIWLEYAIVRVGVPVAIALGGVGLMTESRFWPGLILLYIGLGLFALDVAYEKSFRKLPRLLQIFLGVVYFLAIVTASRLWIFFPAPLQVSAGSSVPVYGAGSILHDIEWLPRFSEMDVEVRNPTSVDYDNFDALLSTDLVINHLVQIGGLGQCNIESVHGSIDPAHWQRMENGKPVGKIDEPPWEYQTVPVDKNGNPVVPFSGADWTYRIRCDRIPAGSYVALFGALVKVDSQAYGCAAPCPYPFFDPPQAAKVITLDANFQTLGRKHTERIVKR